MQIYLETVEACECKLNLSASATICRKPTYQMSKLQPVNVPKQGQKYISVHPIIVFIFNYNPGY